MAKSTEVKRYNAVGSFLAGAFVIATYSQARVQIFDRDRIVKEAGDIAHFNLEKSEPARRGSIFSADGKVLAQSEDTYELGLNYKKVPHSPGFFVSLAEACSVPATELSPAGDSVNGRVWRTPLTFEQAEKIRQVRRDWGADGVSLARTNRRDYPLSEAVSGVVGAFRDNKPIAGIEVSLDEWLSGHDGHYKGFVDRSGTFVVDKDHPFEKRQNGQNVVLTIDSTLQASAIQAVRASVEANKAKSGCAVVIDPKTGDVLAMANWPTFDPNSSWKPGDDFDMAYMGGYEPGSTFKILTLAKALDDGVIGLDDHYNCVGQMTVGKAVIHCDSHHGVRAHGNVSLETALAKSCNDAAATWALKIGREPMIDFMDKLRLFEKPEIGLPSEGTGSYNKKEYAQRLQLATMGFGQSMNCVPVSLAAAYALIANNGMMMKPRLVKQVGDKETPIVQQGQMIKPEVANTVKTFMESVIQSDFGTGKSLKIPGYRLAGKTGTAQKVGTSNGMYVANFVGMVPAQDPRAVVLVMIDSPSAGKYYGGTVAGPVFEDIAKAVIRRYSIPPTEKVGR